MLKCTGEPVPILKPFKAVFSYNIHTPHQPDDVRMQFVLDDEPTIVESTKDEIFVNGVPFRDWIEQSTEKITKYTIQKLLHTMVISAVCGEDRYLKLLKEETNEK